MMQDMRRGAIVRYAKATRIVWRLHAQIESTRGHCGRELSDRPVEHPAELHRDEGKARFATHGCAHERASFRHEQYLRQSLLESTHRRERGLVTGTVVLSHVHRFERGRKEVGLVGLRLQEKIVGE